MGPASYVSSMDTRPDIVLTPSQLNQTIGEEETSEEGVAEEISGKNTKTRREISS